MLTAISREKDDVDSSTKTDSPPLSDEKLAKLLDQPAGDADRQIIAVAEASARQGGSLDEQWGTFSADEIEEGTMMAIFSHFSIMFGIPVFVATLYLRDNSFALHHAKAAGVIYLACMAMLAAALLNCAFFLPLVFVCYIPALIGIYRAAAGVEAGTAALGTIGERVFSWVKLKS